MKDVEIIEVHAMPDHIHMLVRVPPKNEYIQFSGVSERSKCRANS